MQTMQDFTVMAADGATMSLDRYRGQVVLVVNVASKCGFTPQYAGLQTLQREYAGRGFCVLGFPCNQFGAQEPGDAADIASFCTLKYDVDFPLLAKIEVNGAGASPFYAWLKHAKPGLLGIEAIKWNFTKFLVGRDGEVLERFAPTTPPEKLRPAIEAALGAALSRGASSGAVRP